MSTESAKDEILAMLAPLFERAEREDLYFFTTAAEEEPLWFTPEELRDQHQRDDFVWGPDNWQLRSPLERVAELQAVVTAAERDRDHFILKNNRIVEKRRDRAHLARQAEIRRSDPEAKCIGCGHSIGQHGIRLGSDTDPGCDAPTCDDGCCNCGCGHFEEVGRVCLCGIQHQKKVVASTPLPEWGAR